LVWKVLMFCLVDVHVWSGGCPSCDWWMCMSDHDGIIGCPCFVIYEYPCMSIWMSKFYLLGVHVVPYMPMEMSLRMSVHV